MSVSSIGIMSAQAYWIYIEAMQAAEEFDSKVYESLTEVSERFKNEETLVFVQNRVDKAFGFSTIDLIEEDTEEKVLIRIDGNNRQETIIMGSDSNPRVLRTEIEKDFNWSEDSLKMEIIELESNLYSDSIRFNVFLKEKKEQLKTTLDKLAFEYAINEKSLKERLSKTSIDSLISYSLASFGIDEPFKYEVKSKSNERLESSEDFNSSYNKVYETNLYEGLLKNNTAILSVYFPSKVGSIIKSIWINLLISIVLILTLLGTFSYTLYSILRQKRLAKVKSDFINNMTHEFKTPIATISLAIDNMMHPLVRKDEKQIEKFGHIIKKENERMDLQIGRVLEIARLEKQDIILKKEKVNLNQLICEVVDSFNVNIEENQGDINLNSSTKDETIIADKMHLFNALRNVIENGIKYSKKQFRISIHSFIESEVWVVKISDKGIGMNQNTLKHIFDRFYRRTEGNLHETKGFGLGLFYTHNIITKHGGQINVKSKLGAGSQFEIRIPFS